MHSSLVILSNPGKGLGLTHSLVELVNASACINELLLACIERMALGADFNLDILLCGHSLDHVAAVAGNCCLNKVRMDSLFHDCHLFHRFFVSVQPISSLRQ